MPITPVQYGGHLTIAEVIDEIDRNLGSRGSTDDPGYTRIRRHIDLAMTRIAREDDWVDLQREVAVTTAFTGVPATDAVFNPHALILTAASHDVRLIYSMCIIEGESTDHKLIQLMPRQWDLMFPDPTSGYSVAGSLAEITHYVMWDKLKVQLYRVPGAAVPLRIRYGIWPRAIYGIDGTSNLDLENKDELVIVLATHNLFQSLGMREDAKQYFAIYNDLLDRAKKDNSLNPDASRVPVRLSEAGNSSPGNYWSDPFTKEMP